MILFTCTSMPDGSPRSKSDLIWFSVTIQPLCWTGRAGYEQIRPFRRESRIGNRVQLKGGIAVRAHVAKHHDAFLVNDATAILFDRRDRKDGVARIEEQRDAILRQLRRNRRSAIVEVQMLAQIHAGKIPPSAGGNVGLLPNHVDEPLRVMIGTVAGGDVSLLVGRWDGTGRTRSEGPERHDTREDENEPSGNGDEFGRPNRRSEPPCDAPQKCSRLEGSEHGNDIKRDRDVIFVRPDFHPHRDPR